MIESFEARYAESRAEVAQLAEQLAAAEQASETSGVRVRELVDANARLREQQQQQAAARADAEAALSAQVAALQGETARVSLLQQRLAQVEGELADAQADLATAHRQRETLVATVDAANDAIVVRLGPARPLAPGLWSGCADNESAVCSQTHVQSQLLLLQSVQAALSEQEQVVAQRDAEVASLQAHLGRLLGVSDADVPALHMARFGPQTSAAQQPDRAAAARIAALEVRKLPGRQPGLRMAAAWF